MPLKKENYPDYLNPFGSDDDNEFEKPDDQPDEYPQYLSPFGDEETECKDEYDESLNPFGSEDGGTDQAKLTTDPNEAKDDQTESQNVEAQARDDQVEEEQSQVETQPNQIKVKEEPEQEQRLSLESPPIPLPRTKSLLKKELALKNKQANQPGLGSSNDLSRQGSNESSCKSTSITSDNLTVTKPDIPPPPPPNPPNTFQRNKLKRNAPPVPVNFKRQVCGSLEEIEKELNEIGDSLQDIEKEFLACQQAVISNYNVDDAQFISARGKLIDMIKRKSSIVRHQKELMYRKRELKLDQIHSDIEYELRMIGNKQISNRTPEDDKREKELLTSLVEIVEEKSDIVENLNKDSACDNQDIEETFKRLNIDINCPNKNEKSVESSNNEITDISAEGDNCDKSKGSKLSKIATLLPKTGTIKGKIKMKRKRMFKKHNSHSLEH